MSENNFFDKLTDTVLDEAAKKACDNPDIEDAFDCEEIEFSPEHEKKMQEILKSANKGSFSSWLNKYGKRVACIALVFLVASFAAILSVDAWRMRLFWFVIDEGEPNTDFSLVKNYSTYSDDYISLGYVPDGLSLESADYGELGSVWCFANGVDYFVLSMESINSNHSFDTENGTAENLQINGNDGVYISTPDVNTLFWVAPDAIYTMTGNLDKSVMIKIAENIKS